MTPSSSDQVRPGLVRLRVKVDAVLRHVSGDDLDVVPNASGAYVIRVESGARYVGSSNTTRARIQAHRVANDPSVREPIRSVCCYLTEQHMDARILEHWLIREVGPELNLSCPAGIASPGTRCSGECERIERPGRTLGFGVRVTSTRDRISPAKLELVTTGPGVYVLTTESGKRYVGVSRSVRGRVRTHRDNPAHPNLDSPVRSISVVETGTEADARILEYAMIRNIEPELNRENQPDASEWKEVRREVLLATAPRDLKDLQQKLARRIKQIGGREVVRRSWITYQLSPMKNFCAVKVLSDCVQVDLKVDERRYRDPDGISKRIERTQAWTFNRRIRVRSATDLDAAIGLVAQAYECLAEP